MWILSLAVWKSMEPSSSAGSHGTNVHTQSSLSEEVPVPSDMEKVTTMEKQLWNSILRVAEVTVSSSKCTATALELEVNYGRYNLFLPAQHPFPFLFPFQFPSEVKILYCKSYYKIVSKIMLS